MSIYDERPIGDIYVEWANTLDSAGQNSVPARSRLCTYDTMARMYMMMEAVKSAGLLADHVKKFVFYGAEGVIDQVPDTLPVSHAKLTHAKESFDDHDTVRILHGILGLVTEAAEMMEMLQSHVFDFAALNMQNLLEECGDQTWYLALLAKSLDLATFNEFFATNKAKLTERYGQQWNQEGALNRDTEAEMKALDSAKDPVEWAGVAEKLLGNPEGFGQVYGEHSKRYAVGVERGGIRSRWEVWDNNPNTAMQRGQSLHTNQFGFGAEGEAISVVAFEMSPNESLPDYKDKLKAAIAQSRWDVDREEWIPKHTVAWESPTHASPVEDIKAVLPRPISDTGTCPECHHGWHCDPNVHCEDPACECKFTTLKAKRD